jgi:hypothetical protein
MGTTDEIWETALSVNLTGPWRTASGDSAHDRTGWRFDHLHDIGCQQDHVLRVGPLHSVQVRVDRPDADPLRGADALLDPGQRHRPSAVDTPLGFNEHNVELFTGRPGATKADALPIFESLNLLPVGLLEPQDISYAALFLASDESRYVTGVEIWVDAGTANQPPGVPPIAYAEIAELRQALAAQG